MPAPVEQPDPSFRKITTGRVWRGLLWGEWYANSRLLLLFLAGWLVCVWVLPLLAHPGWILLFGLVYAVFAGPAFGGGDVIEGCEEFSLALPPTRGERFLARLIVGGGALLVFTGMDLLALGLDLSQALARLYIDTGLLRPLQVSQPGLLYGLVFAFPFAVFACGFAWASVTRSRAQVLSAWFWGGLASLLALRAGLGIEQWRWRNLNGLVSCPLLGVLGAVALVAAWRCHRRKEVGPASVPLHLPMNWWLWLIAFGAGIGIAAVLLVWLLRTARLVVGSG